MKDRIKKQHTGGAGKTHSDIRSTGLLLSGVLLMALATGCVKDELYNMPHPDRGTLAVTTDWTAASSEAVLPETYILRTGDGEQEVDRTAGALLSGMAPGHYALLAYNKPAGITTEDNTARVNTLEDGTLEPLPGYLFSAAKEIEMTAGGTLKASMPMRQHIRLLSLSLKMEEGDRERLASVTATLGGIAPSVDLTTGTLTGTEGKTVIPTFRDATDDKAGEGTGKSVLRADLRLLGVVPAEKQELKLVLELADGSRQTLTTDLTAHLEDFSGNEREPLMLYTLLELTTEAGVGATINGWEVADNGDIDIH